jgi:hypothetical protein
MMGDFYKAFVKSLDLFLRFDEITLSSRKVSDQPIIIRENTKTVSTVLT